MINVHSVQKPNDPAPNGFTVLEIYCFDRLVQSVEIDNSIVDIVQSRLFNTEFSQILFDSLQEKLGRTPTLEEFFAYMQTELFPKGV